MGIYILRCLKENHLGLQVWVISNTMFSYATKKLKNKAILSLKQQRLCCYVILSSIIYILFILRFIQWSHKAFCQGMFVCSTI